jgi:hypothetical protein
MKLDKKYLISGIADINQGYARPEKHVKEVFGHRIASIYVCLAAERRFEEVGAARFARFSAGLRIRNQTPNSSHETPVTKATRDRPFSLRKRFCESGFKREGRGRLGGYCLEGRGATMDDDLPAFVSLYFDILRSMSTEKRGVAEIFDCHIASVG